MRVKGLLTCLVFVLGVTARPAAAQEPRPPDLEVEGDRARRIESQSWKEVFSGPFRSSRLFTMPVGDVIGAYQLSASGDSSLLSEPGVLSTTSFVAVGVGDIAQIEYRSEAATTVETRPREILLPSLGVQLKAPLPDDNGWPSLAIALRLGLPYDDAIEAEGEVFEVEEQLTDAYVVVSFPFWGSLRWLTLHAGLRVGQSSMISRDDRVEDVEEYILLPAGGFEIELMSRARLVSELAAIPSFEPGSPMEPGRVSSRPFGRLGIRWLLHPAIIFDASMGYRIETNRVDSSAGGLNALVDWDIRLGGEIFVPWGAIACRAGGIFCE